MRTRPALEVLEELNGPFHFGCFAVAARVSLDLTQSQMAKKLKMARGTLCDIEKGRQIVSPKLAAKIAKMAGFSEEFAVESCLQDQLNRLNLKYKVKLQAG